MRFHLGGASFCVFSASHAILHPQSTDYTPQHQRPATKR